MLAFRLETWEEAKVIFIFHVVGTAMGIFKTSVGSWTYPEASILRIGGVPLFTGFMYAAIGSYIARCWRLFDFRFTRHPPLWVLVLLALGIYVNFFAHHYVWDARVLLFALTALLFGRCWVHFKVWRVHRRMPLLLGFGLVALFIWFAENIGTLTAAWMYPNQRHGWELVGIRQARRVAPADDHQLRSGGAGEPAAGDARRRGAAGRSRAGRALRLPIGAGVAIGMLVAFDGRQLGGAGIRERGVARHLRDVADPDQLRLGSDRVGGRDPLRVVEGAGRAAR